ncbi:DUF1127 domain-containing protein [Rhizobium paknamense]|uniref:Uncharacterized protein YjiS (DUF1127 family) n=1 Tax=Rhizobium paknamense TaxID=1206817 RepID=A0ABU0I7J9_9HYPH|nr:DUF1127 domain-containing protein [Rhizobium paknamense]MDQ0454199.1 uncharacterized protein YjiS (DUF1127 family) [Rhizobium paknamense]
MNIQRKSQMGLLRQVARLLVQPVALISRLNFRRRQVNSVAELSAHQLRDLGLQSQAPPFDAEERLRQAKLDASLLMFGLNGR